MSDESRTTGLSQAPATPQVCLTVLVPAAVEDRVVDWLLALPGAPVEFSVHAVAARGPLVHLAPGEERVQGYARRVELKLIVGRERLQALIDEIEALLTGVDGGYWVLPVERFAVFARPAASSTKDSGAAA